MEENFTHQHKLVEVITNSGWFADPAGKEGYEIIVLEKVGSGGTKYYASLKAGETLRWTERLFSQYVVFQVDLRRARAFSINGSFFTRERGRSVNLNANVRYHVTNARTVATQTVDPLGELRDKVVSTLNREMKRLPESEITPATIEDIIEGVGNMPHLGLAVESAEVQSFSGDTRVIQHVINEEDARHNISIGEIRHEADLNVKDLEFEADLRRRQRVHDTIDLRDMNIFMHEHPELVPQILATLSARDMKLLDANIDVAKASVDRYIAQQIEMNQEVNPVEIGRIMREAVGTSSLQIGQPNSSSKLIDWGGDEEKDSLEKKKTNGKKEKENDNDSRIEFGS